MSKTQKKPTAPATPRTDVQFALRVPAELYERAKKRAAAARWSLNTWIVVQMEKAAEGKA